MRENNKSEKRTADALERIADALEKIVDTADEVLFGEDADDEADATDRKELKPSNWMGQVHRRNNDDEDDKA